MYILGCYRNQLGMLKISIFFSISFVFAISIGLPKTSYRQTAAYGQFIKCVLYVFGTC